MHHVFALRLVRNVFVPEPQEVTPVTMCNDTNDVTILMATKDACSNAGVTVAKLAAIVDINTPMVYIVPNYTDCRDAAPTDLLQTLFPNSETFVVDAHTSPLGMFKLAAPLVKTPFALLTYNDVVPMDVFAICELRRGLVQQPDAIIAAPQLYEVSDDGIIVPHGHHTNLRVEENTVRYDIDIDLVTRRKRCDFYEHKQMDFVEDHAFLIRSDSISETLDADASFTMEYIDLALALLRQNSFAWYVPTSRFVFDVRPSRVGWRDIGYLMRKRSDEYAENVRTHLTSKWNTTFLSTGIWKYVRASMVEKQEFSGDRLPDDRGAQLRMVAAWFEHIGFNRYNGGLTHEELTDVPELRNASRAIPEMAQVTLPVADAKALLPSFSSHVQRVVEPQWNVQAWEKSRSCYADACDLLFTTADGCACWRADRGYADRFDFMEDVLRLFRLPARVWTYIKMVHFKSAVSGETFTTIGFGKDSRLLKWKIS